MVYHGLTQAPCQALLWPFYHPRRTCQKGRGAVVLLNNMPFRNSSFACLEIKGSAMGSDDIIAGNVSKYIVLPAGYCGQPKKGHLIFDACFESGNLGRVDHVSEFEYDLFIRPDTCNPRFRVWFNFTVENVKESQQVSAGVGMTMLFGYPRQERVIFNVVNFSKTKSLYRDGMAPMVKSTSRPKWQRIPSKNVYYYRCPDHRKNYVMSFAFCFDREDDTYQFAYCYPYTYTRLQHYLDNLQRRNMDYFCRELLGLSVQKRRLDLLTITSPEDKTDLENSVMQKKIKIPKLSLNHIEEAGEVTDYGEEDVELRHSKRQDGRKQSEGTHKSIEAVVARLEKQNGMSLSNTSSPEEAFMEATEGMNNMDNAVVPRILYEELLRSYQQQQEEMRHIQQELERTRRQLVQQAKKLKEYGALVSEMKELRDLNRRLQDVLLLRLGSECLYDRIAQETVDETEIAQRLSKVNKYICEKIMDINKSCKNEERREIAKYNLQ
uniref:Cytosolic carboxypeptidase N-terminal domain-containing protein n=1 Tax=Zonotrichia albicollis TaxID=44394 RepID=A0A8D2M2M8_ZONAL